MHYNPKKLPKTLNILTNLKNKVNKLYLLFLSYVFKIMITVNLEFQSEEARLHQLMPRISQSYKLLGNKMKSIYVYRYNCITSNQS